MPNNFNNFPNWNRQPASTAHACPKSSSRSAAQTRLLHPPLRKLPGKTRPRSTIKSPFISKAKTPASGRAKAKRMTSIKCGGNSKPSWEWIRPGRPMLAIASSNFWRIRRQLQTPIWKRRTTFLKASRRKFKRSSRNWALGIWRKTEYQSNHFANWSSL